LNIVSAVKNLFGSNMQCVAFSHHEAIIS